MRKPMLVPAKFGGLAKLFDMLFEYFFFFLVILRNVLNSATTLDIFKNPNDFCRV